MAGAVLIAYAAWSARIRFVWAVLAAPTAFTFATLSAKVYPALLPVLVPLVFAVAGFIAEEVKRSGMLDDYPNIDGIVALIMGLSRAITPGTNVVLGADYELVML